MKNEQAYRSGDSDENRILFYDGVMRILSSKVDRRA